VIENFREFFIAGSEGKEPYPFQECLALNPWRKTLVIPTGFGKTAAIIASWLWKMENGDPETPQRLVYCLPMRTLVDQTESVAREWLQRSEITQSVVVDVLMGGREKGQFGIPEWLKNPEKPAILIGTQDMLVSAALMRGYGTRRYRWPVDFALLHNDALWVFDEVQLAGAALPTSAQLEGLRKKLGFARTTKTLWMSATLDPTWLRTPDFETLDEQRPHDLSTEDIEKASSLWHARKSLAPLEPSPPLPTGKDGEKDYAKAVANAALDHLRAGKNTIVFLNTVARTQNVYSALKKIQPNVGCVLVHSRFRKIDRDERVRMITADPPPAGRIILATQALEAGIDITSGVMITEIAPWSSLVQRFGRCNRKGEENDVGGAEISWIDLPDEKLAPYTLEEIAESREKLAGLTACGPADLANIAPSAPRRGQVLRRRDLLDLFDTEPDLTGFDVDVSPYVREASDTDVRLFWRPVDGENPSADAYSPAHEELCPAPIGGAKSLLKRAEEGKRAWIWDSLERQWRSIRAAELYPGLTIWIDSAVGGYDPERGFLPESKAPVIAVDVADGNLGGEGFSDDPATKTRNRVSLAKHSVHVRNNAECLADALDVTGAERDILLDAALWHDLGKAHTEFKKRCGLDEGEQPLAKTPSYNWRVGERPSFRHELASALAYLADKNWDRSADLAAYLIAAHHGKVRMRIGALPNERRPEEDKLFARGVWDGDRLPATSLGDKTVPETTLALDIMQLGEGRHGASWAARTQALLKQYGPFRLAWLEALLRIADWRASAQEDEADHDDL